MEKRIINLEMLGSKARSKWELYRLLTAEAGLFLPPYRHCSVDFIADILDESKRALKCNEVAVRKVPQIEGLRIKDLLIFCINVCKGEAFLPENVFKTPPDRDWLCNLCNSISPDEFDSLITNALEIRERSMLSKSCLTIEVSKEFADAIENSRMVSRAKDRSNLLLNRTKRFERKQKEQVEKQNKLQEQEHMKLMEEEIASFRTEILSLKDKQKDYEKNRAILRNLYDQKIIDESGNLL